MIETVRPSSKKKIEDALARLGANIADIRRGELDTHVESEFAGDHPVGALADAVREMLVALRETKRSRALQEHELEDRIRTIHEQRSAIMELSSPVIEVWRGVLTLPIVGTVDSERATTMTTNLLSEVVRASAELAIIDVTGVHGVAADVCDHILRMARCVRLLGTDCAISGMRPEVARTIVELGSELGEVSSFPNLRAALKRHVNARRRRGPGRSPAADARRGVTEPNTSRTERRWQTKE